MPMSLRAPIVLLAALACTACATLNEHECRSGDWRQIGYQDGLRGYATSRLAEHQKSCAEHGLAGDANAWHLGYVEGQARYCTAENGYRLGRDGRSYADVCPPELDRGFRPAYEDGQFVGRLLTSLTSLESELDRVGALLEEDDRRGAAYLEAIRNGRRPPESTRLLAADERRRAEQDHARLSHDHHHVLDELAARDAALSARHGAEPLRLEPRH